MKEYVVSLFPESVMDVDDICHYIAYELMLPLTAQRYREGILKTIYQLTIVGGSLAVSPMEYIQRRYGPDARTIIYKEFTIIYNVIDNVVLIRRVMASRLIH